MAPWRHLHAGWVGLALAAPALLTLAAPAVAQSIPLSPVAQASGAAITHEQGIEFVTIGAAGNAGWPGTGVPNRVVGRGAVGYQYRIGRFEVTTAQWVEFYNAAFDRPPSERLPHLVPPGHWGAVGTTPTVPGGIRWRVPTGNELIPVGNIDWRMAAMYCNWLHNDKSSDRAAFLNGAYAVSTFGYDNSGFTDQFTHNAGARYWIPTWDEWIKAAHYDPHRHGPGQDGWWTYSITSDLIPAYGPPGLRVTQGVTPRADPNGPFAQANAAWDFVNFPGYNAFSIALGAYPTMQSPWGLLDTAGGTTEWTEETLFVSGIFPSARVFEGSAWADPGTALGDQLRVFGGDFPTLSTYALGFRVAAAIPAPGTMSLIALSAVVLLRRSRRRRITGGFGQVG